MDNNQTNFPYNFNSSACKSCRGKCCRGLGGYVWLSMEELERIAETKNMDVAKFANKYARQVEGKLSLQERVINGEHFCCFFDMINSHCEIYEIRPKQCKAFPFWNQFKKDPKKLFLECPGVTFKPSI
ncbi:MAG: YkgJ family cysteine cluster protein [Desulfamplus sp.]|nr:YkgJ family cysteine cluster protein [Desulfamplus sp.]